MALTQQDEETLDALEKMGWKAALAIEAACIAVQQAFVDDGFRAFPEYEGSDDLLVLKAAVTRFFVAAQTGDEIERLKPPADDDDDEGAA